MSKHIDWVSETYAIIRTCQKSGCDPFEYAKGIVLEHRLSAAYLGFYCTQENVKAQVNLTLKKNGFSPLTHRNPNDALFIYAYIALGDTELNSKFPSFKALCNEFLSWENKAANQPQNISTFGELRDTLALNSKVSETQTMKTDTMTSANLTLKIEEFSKQKNGLHLFLDYIESDPATRAFNHKATYYVQRMLYDILKTAPDILYLHNIPEEMFPQYEKARKSALANSRNFNRFLNYNRFFLEGIKGSDLREVCIDDNAEPERLAALLSDSLSPFEISYSRLFDDLFKFLIMERNALKARTKNEPFDTVAEIDHDIYTKVFGKADASKTMTTRLAGYISGKFTISREFLIIFGLYAGCNIERMDHILAQCDFAPLEHNTDINPFDSIICSYMNEGFADTLKNSINTKNFIERTTDTHYGYESDIVTKGLKERNTFDALLSEFRNGFKGALEISDHDMLCGIFEKKKTTDSISRQKNEIKKIK